MITGQTPFQSTSQNEIYRRARSVEYSWPETDHLNYIPPEAKDLVGRLLRIDAEQRPSPDEIVSHPFFAMGGGNRIPDVMEEPSRRHLPSFLDPRAHPRGDVMLSGSRKISLKCLAQTCGVGNTPAVGADTHISLYRVCAAEEAAGCSPIIPIPEGKVYLSAYSTIRDPDQSVSKTELPRKVQSHAASLRSPQQKEDKDSSAKTHGARQRETRRPLTELPVRPKRPATRSQVQSTPQKALTKDQIIDKLSPNPDEERRKQAARQRGRIASNIEKEIRVEIPNTPNSPSKEKDKRREASKARGVNPRKCLFTNGEEIPNTRPDEVLTRLQQLHKKMQQSLDTLTARRSYSVREIEAKSMAFAHRPLVKVWVDYTNRFGIGYILSDGTIGCMFNKTEDCSSTGLLIPDSENHVRSRKRADYAEKDQLAPMLRSIEFLDCNTESGFRRATFKTQEFRVRVSSKGKTEFDRPEQDDCEHSRRRAFILWNNFAQYMVKSLSGQRQLKVKREPTFSVTFYQSLGNVGIYGFSPLSLSKRKIQPAFQFNFPDHSKMVLFECEKNSSPNTYLWVDFYYLNDSEGSLERTMLSYPLMVLLDGRYEDHVFGKDLDHLQFRQKVAWVKGVFQTWVANGGLGRLPKDQEEMRWTGEEDTKRNAWTTVGNY